MSKHEHVLQLLIPGLRRNLSARQRGQENRRQREAANWEEASKKKRTLTDRV